MTSSLIDFRLKKLKEDTPAKFGIMTPQHMVEHLTITLKISSGRIKLPEFTVGEKDAKLKQDLLYTELEFPEGVKYPKDTGKLMELRFPDLETAKQKLNEALAEYQQVSTETPDFKTVHPRFSTLTKEEWDTFHQKHFKHHFSQFGIWE